MDSIKKENELEGVIVQSLKVISDDRGSVLQMLRNDSSLFINFGEIYFSEINPKIINGSRKKRISSGSGADTATINKLLKQFKMMTNMMKKMSKGGHKDGIPPDILNQLK